MRDCLHEADCTSRLHETAKAIQEQGGQTLKSKRNVLRIGADEGFPNVPMRREFKMSLVRSPHPIEVCPRPAFEELCLCSTNRLAQRHYRDVTGLSTLQLSLQSESRENHIGRRRGRAPCPQPRIIVFVPIPRVAIVRVVGHNNSSPSPLFVPHLLLPNPQSHEDDRYHSPSA
jgi:hypothetical protein